ncbi:glycine dehydrogenase subunit 2 [Microbotryum lychnidis-dioicae p1A1 Lamole]|uniref:glycine dehydrogenase (aminomethyl-transferring) n=1 Tax=Microbotryum lychnidis-dioicae (strain p1A1 Lamole / MvSl-1064) TaxID=683840 RepID=U5GZI1_USTV1|nr:glycine dehydrogenase subunit 2 [Microbotryum lychnidis-dioicae p1A1 Lamole]|eukprot:KDE09263.1 glycine dehydrogenase subunit 2 [Microbotryum lychnidis-dioicae p1A1 Lamole]
MMMMNRCNLTAGQSLRMAATAGLGGASRRSPAVTTAWLHSAARSGPLSPASAASEVRAAGSYRTLATESSSKPPTRKVNAVASRGSVFAPLDTFTRRHVGPQPASIEKMLDTLGYTSMDAFINDCVPSSIRISDQEVSETGGRAIVALSEQELLRRATELAKKNRVHRSFIGLGYHQAVVPPVILRNVLENHGWFSQYSPYQAEISQGRLESLINFQTMTTSLTGMDIANASLLDEGTAAAEAIIMAFGQLREKRRTFLVDRGVNPQTIAVVKTRAEPFGIKIRVGNVNKLLQQAEEDPARAKDVMGILLQYPDMRGEVADWKDIADRTHTIGGLVTCATDFLALTMLKPPGEWGCDMVFGNSARFGVPMGFGGPHAAFFACTDALKRRMPGRLIGLSKDAEGRPAYRLALQTREQHIRREKATSNICTAQALLANISAMYAVYHGPEGLRQIAEKVHGITRVVAAGIESLGHSVVNETYFDTLTIRLNGVAASLVHEAAEREHINLRRVDSDHVALTFDESNSLEDIVDLMNVFVSVRGRTKDVPYMLETLVAYADKLGIQAPGRMSSAEGKASSGHNIPAHKSPAIPADLARTSPFLTQSVWNSYHSETDILRYMHHLQDKDLSLVHSMIPLGSCTMKLNSTTSMTPLTWAEFSKMHPFAPPEQTIGYLEMMEDLARDLSTMTGLPGCSLQPNSGAQGEYAGLSVIRAYHHARGDQHRDICLVPVSAHGTNPASAIMSGMKVVPVKVLSTGYLDLEDLKLKADEHRDNLSAFMITYPSTYGVFESGVEEACKIIHEAGGQVYLDGANFNAMIGLTSPGRVGGDVCHLNLHKTFGIPHGGGGPGMGPICCAEHLTPYLPSHPVIPTGGSEPIGPISAAPFGSASILSISWAYIKMLGGDGLTHATKVALLNANYAMKRLEPYYRVKFVNEQGRCAHEFIIDLAEFDDSAGLKVMDFAKRLQDFGIHPPTCSWPLNTAMLIEPTESEGLRDIDMFCDAMIKIRQEADEIAAGKQPRDNNIIKNAPHTQQVVMANEWNRPYSREEAAYPDKRLRQRKFWPSVSRVDDSYGDRNLVCECGTVDEYAS